MIEILFPVGRMVGGNLAKMFQAKDDKGALKTDATEQVGGQVSASA